MHRAMLTGWSLIVLSTLTSAAQPLAQADLILLNGKVATLNARSDFAEAVAIKDGKVMAVGSNADIAAGKGPATRVIDLRGHTVIPGLQDSHVHVSNIGASTFTDAQIGGARSVVEILDIIKEAAKKKAPGEWVTVSRDLRLIRIREGRYPTKAELDSVAPNNPVLVPTGHLSTANSAALKAANITRNTPNPTGGVIHRDANGDPDGVLEEQASGLVARLIPARTIDVSQAIENSQKRLVSLGFTTVREPGVSHDVLESYRKLQRENRLLLRSAVLLRPQGNGEDIVRQIESWKDEVGKGDDMLKVWEIKLSLDGALVLTNAGLMHAPYLDKPGYRGIQQIPTGIYNRAVAVANRVGFAVATHATGDAGIDLAVDAYAKASAETNIRGRRFSVEHEYLPTPHAIAVQKDYGIIASIQPSQLTSAPAVLIGQLGSNRADGFLPYQTFKKEGIVMAGGSDSPAFEVNPYIGLWSAITRKVTAADQVVNAPQVLSREDALRIYVQGGAYLTFDENNKGSIEPGKFADFTVLSGDYFTIDVDKIREITPLYTIVGGKIVYQKPTL
jgi:hypothetical protein